MANPPGPQERPVRRPDQAVPIAGQRLAGQDTRQSRGPALTQPGSIALRFAAWFAAVALAAVALLAGLTAAFSAADVSHLVNKHRAYLTSTLAFAAFGAWDHQDSWAGADLAPVLRLAARGGADLQIRDQVGRPIASSPGFASDRGNPQLSGPIVIGKHKIGQAVVRFTGSGLAAADQALRTALWRAIAGAAGLAALLALLAGLVVARWITRPIGHLIAATRARARGDRRSRVGLVRAPGELGELATSFDQMADAVDREEQLRRDLVADVAHELRTPIAVLQAEHEALLDGVTEPTAAQFSALRDQVLRLARIVGDLQTLSEADAAALRMTAERADLAEIAADASDSLAGRFEAAGIAMDRQLAPVEVVGDADRLHQVVANLLTNALKFTPPGGQVTIEAGRPDGNALLRVSDTGAGIPADELPHIFDRFWRGQKAANTAGSGIGLAVAAELASAHGGELTAASTEGRGTEMTLTLPRALGAGQAIPRLRRQGEQSGLNR
jgi:two-component system, OmpR family, sensor histidine kinase BaeS